MVFDRLRFMKIRTTFILFLIIYSWLGALGELIVFGSYFSENYFLESSVWNSLVHFNLWNLIPLIITNVVLLGEVKKWKVQFIPLLFNGLYFLLLLDDLHEV